MALNKNSYRVLIVGANDKTFALLSQLLQSGSYEMPLRSGTAGEARRMLLETSADIVIINAPLRDEFGTQLAQNLADDNLAVILLVPGESYDQV